MNAGATAFVDTHSAMNRVPRTVVRAVDAGKEVEIHAVPPVDDLDLVEPELISLTAPDGALVRVKLLRPRAVEPESRLPVVVYVYGGPGAPIIRDAWRHQSELFHRLLVRRGYVVAWVDDRSSSILGHRYEVAADHAWGPVAAADHAVAVEYLRSLPFVDPERMAVWGWSGGGTMTCYHMTHTKLFRVGIAVAPVTDWRLYDSVYTERYMGLPDAEPEAYRRASIVEAAADLRGDLLLIHGSHDDNVHPQNTFRLLDALIEHGRPIDLMLYPDKTHSIYGGTARTHLFQKFVRYLEEHL
jgi:dipeptidyl-peptidase-4